QTFTYSTGLALTGRSAACPALTATKPAAEPRRRLFTIFISNLQLLPWEGSVSAGWVFTPRRPPSSPKPPGPSTPRKHRTHRLRVPPSVAPSPYRTSSDRQ